MSSRLVNLLTALSHYRPRVIVELGSWYGKSTRFILKHAAPDVTLYCVDHYKNNAIYTHQHETPVPEDKMLFNFPRYETIVASVEECGRVPQCSFAAVYQVAKRSIIIMIEMISICANLRAIVLPLRTSMQICDFRLKNQLLIFRNLIM